MILRFGASKQLFVCELNSIVYIGVDVECVLGSRLNSRGCLCWLISRLCRQEMLNKLSELMSRKFFKLI